MVRCAVVDLKRSTGEKTTEYDRVCDLKILNGYYGPGIGMIIYPYTPLLGASG